MHLGVIAFLFGIVLFQQLPELPDGYWLIPLIVAALLVWRRPSLRLLSWFLAGVVIVFLHAHTIFSSSLAPELVGRDVVVEGRVSSIPEIRPRSVRIEFNIDAVQSPEITQGMLPARVRLNIYERELNPQVGERWQFRIRLKQPHGFMNPGGFDYEAWLFRNQIRATGYVRKGSENRLLQSASLYSIDSIRVEIAKQIDLALPESKYTGLIKALAIGLRDDITDEQWQTLLKTGTNHLMAISGLHVGLIAALAFFLFRYVWAWLPGLALRVPGQKVGAFGAIFAAFGYAALAGFSVPTQRALIMVCVFMLSLLMQRFRKPMDGLCLALLLVLVLDPLAVMDAGFWLSFAAVGFILFSMSGRLYGKGGVWWRWGRVHVVLGITLVPITLLFFGKASLISPLANFVAVPWMSLLVVPLVLFGAVTLLFFPLVGEIILVVADCLIDAIWPLLEWGAALPVSQVSYALVQGWMVVPAVVGVVWLMMPKGWPARWLGGVWLGCALFAPFPRPQQGEVWFSLLDVGQGLAAVVQTREHVLVFDTGPKFGKGFDTGEAVIVPFLKQAGWHSVDTLIVSHGDNDHIGGADSVMEHMAVARLLTSAPKKLSRYAPEQCKYGQQWQWNGVGFEILHPGNDKRLSKNNRSCVLKVSTGESSLLLTGDIERAAEKSLVAKQSDAVDVDILVVPHHGSKTSSTEAFIDAVTPEWALIPVGYQNRFRLPRAEIVDRYKERDISIAQTSNNGAIFVRLREDGIDPPQFYRSNAGRYWNQHF